MSRPFIRVTLERKIQGQLKTELLCETQPQSYENPVYNQRLQFDVYDDNDRVLFEVID